jgi:predicted dehydrogenase
MIRIALIGYGYWGTQLARNIAAVPGARLSLVCDPSSGSLGQCRLHHPDVAVNQNPEEAFNAPAIDAVVIATPAASHFALARAALRAGKHVLVEKPFATSVAQAEMLRDESIRRRRVLMVDHTYVLSPAVQAIRGLLETGVLGTPAFYDSARLNLGIIRSDVSVLWDLAAHDLAILDYLIPTAPESIHATTTSLGSDAPARAAWLSLAYPGGFLANVHASWVAPLKTRRILLGGSERLLVFDDLQHSAKLQLVDLAQVPGASAGRSRPSPSARPVPVESAEPLRLLVEQFVECIGTGATPVCDASAGLRVVRWLEAAEQSLRTGRAVSLETAEVAAA